MLKEWVVFFFLTLALFVFFVVTISYFFIDLNFSQVWAWATTTSYQSIDYSKKQNLVYRDLAEVAGTVDFIGQDFLEIPRVGKAIFADIQKMSLFLYQDGRLVRSFPIISVGKPGLPWETPRGQFNILNKEENHLSSITDVWMPYSMQFLGNYFIHGWPYYEDLTPVGLGYSGGCIRLETESAKEIFAFVDRGTPLIVGADNQLNSSFGRYVAKTKNLLPLVTADSYLVADLDIGATLVKKNSQKLYPIASLSKLMTALVFLDQVNPIDTVIVGQDQEIIPYRHVGNLEPGEIFVAKDLLWPLLLESSNKAAEVLAMSIGEKRFVAEMNNRARTIGLTNTKFADPAGIDANNVSSVEELFLLAKHIFFEKNYIFSLSRHEEFELGRHIWRNTNPFVKWEGFLGGKNDQTEIAKQTSLNIFELPFGQEKRRIAIIVLKSDDRDGDTEKLLDYIRNNIYFVKDGDKQ